MKTAKDFVAYVLSRVGCAYWWGAQGQACTRPNLDRLAKEYAGHYTQSYIGRCAKAIGKQAQAFDCSGLVLAAYWGIDRDFFAETNKVKGIPDTSANNLLAKFCTVKGPIGTMPDIAGVLLFKSGHVGIYVGNGLCVEAVNPERGVIKHPYKETPWTHWGKLDGLDYALPAPPKPSYPTLKQGGTGEAVKALQSKLKALGFYSFKVDGAYGPITRQSVISFQKAYGLTVDGIAGPQTLGKLDTL